MSSAVAGVSNEAENRFEGISVTAGKASAHAVAEYKKLLLRPHTHDFRQFLIRIHTRAQVN